MNHRFVRTGLDVLHYSGLSRLMAPFTAGIGVIFMLHHVRPGPDMPSGFSPNAGLDVTPDFLDAVIGFVKARGWRLLSLQQAVAELRAGEVADKPPFAVFTLDDGFRDNFTHAWPVFRRHECPFTIFIAPHFCDGIGELWWDALERVIAENAEIRPMLGDFPDRLPTATEAQKRAAWETLYWPVRLMGQHGQRRWIRRFAAAHGVDLKALCREQVMSWDEVREIAADELCAIGAHTMRHFALARLKDPEEVRHEMLASKSVLEHELKREITTFAYPYGDETSAGYREFALAADVGFEAAVTTRKGIIHPHHADAPLALPRLSLNGFYQKIRYVDVLLSGLPFAISRRLAG